MVTRFTTDTCSPRYVSITIERTWDSGHARAASVLKLARLWTTRFDPWRAFEYPFCLDSLSIRERFRLEFQVFFFFFIADDEADESEWWLSSVDIRGSTGH